MIGMNKNDLRYQKTDILIKKVFKECVNEYGFDKTTVSMICEKAMINRHTFYIHFESKYNLLDEIFNDFEKSVEESSYRRKCSEKVIDTDVNSEWFIDAIIDNQEKFLFLSKCANERMGDFFEKIFVDVPMSKIIKNYYEKKKDILVQLNIKYTVGAALYFVRHWLQNYDKISREQAIEEIRKLNQSDTDTFIKRF